MMTDSSGDKCVKVTVYTFPREIEDIKAYENCVSTRVHEVILPYSDRAFFFLIFSEGEWGSEFRPPPPLRNFQNI